MGPSRISIVRERQWLRENLTLESCYGYSCVRTSWPPAVHHPTHFWVIHSNDRGAGAIGNSSSTAAEAVSYLSVYCGKWDVSVVVST